MLSFRCISYDFYTNQKHLTTNSQLTVGHQKPCVKFYRGSKGKPLLFLFFFLCPYIKKCITINKEKKED